MEYRCHDKLDKMSLALDADLSLVLFMDVRTTLELEGHLEQVSISSLIGVSSVLWSSYVMFCIMLSGLGHLMIVSSRSYYICSST